MDEMMRIYNPGNKALVKAPVTTIIPTNVKETTKKFQKKSKLDILRETLRADAERTEELEKKHPWVPILLNWIVAACFVMAGIFGIWWAYNHHVNTVAEGLTAVAMADYQADQQAIRDAEEARIQAIQNSKENLQKQNAEMKAQVLYGARLFEERYGYSEADLLTLCQCIDNRVVNIGYPDSVETVVNQKDQWVGYSENNPVIDKYYQIALKSEQAKETQEAMPIGSDYVFAQFTERGIYLSNEFGNDHQYNWWRHA